MTAIYESLCPLLGGIGGGRGYTLKVIMALRIFLKIVKVIVTHSSLLHTGTRHVSAIFSRDTNSTGTTGYRQGIKAKAKAKAKAKTKIKTKTKTKIKIRFTSSLSFLSNPFHLITIILYSFISSILVLNLIVTL